MTTLDTAAIRERAEKATPGPWRLRENHGNSLEECNLSICGDIFILTDITGPQYDHCLHNAVFITNARIDVPTLCDEVDRLRAELAAKDALIEEAKEFVEYVASSADDPPHNGFAPSPPAWAQDSLNGNAAAQCGYCGCWLSVVRPGKSQCDWCCDGQDMSVVARAFLAKLKEQE